MNITIEHAIAKLNEQPNSVFAKVMTNGSMIVEIYRPDKIDLQTPHRQDEIYVIIAGSGTFVCDSKKCFFKEGDILFVPALTEHRFEAFTEDFKTWVIFYGPDGGENAKAKI